MSKRTSKPFPDQRLTEEEQAIEDAIDVEALPPTPAEDLAEARAALARARDDRNWGGSRPGAGRPPENRTKKLLSLSPDAVEALDDLTRKSGLNQSATVSRVLVEAARRRN